MSEILEEILKTLRSIDDTLNNQKIDACNSKEAKKIIGVGDDAYLKYFTDEGHLTRIEAGSNTYTYFKSQCFALAERIKNREVIIMPVKKVKTINAGRSKKTKR